MQISYIDNINEVLKYYPKYLNKKTVNIDFDIDLHPNIKSSIWSQDHNSAKETLKILNDYKFYIIIINNGNINTLKYKIKDFTFDDIILNYFKPNKFINGMYIINTSQFVFIEKNKTYNTTFIPIFNIYENIHSYEIPLPIIPIKYKELLNRDEERMNTTIYHSLKIKDSDIEIKNLKIESMYEILTEEDNSFEYKSLLNITNKEDFDERYRNIITISHPKNNYNIYNSIMNNQCYNTNR